MYRGIVINFFVIVGIIVLFTSYLLILSGRKLDKTLKLEKPKAVKQWDRDVNCLTKRAAGCNIGFPRGSYNI